MILVTGKYFNFTLKPTEYNVLCKIIKQSSEPLKFYIKIIFFIE